LLLRRLQLPAKRLDSRYELGQRSGAWQKMLVNRGPEFVIDGYTPGTRTFDGLIFGYYEGGALVYAGRTRSGFTPASREKLSRLFRGLEDRGMPVRKSAEGALRPLGPSLTGEDESVTVGSTRAVAQFEFMEWTPDGHLRHVKYVELRVR
jgi:bifunctional non-homologous end joining protein LigD